MERLDLPQRGLFGVCGCGRCSGWGTSAVGSLLTSKKRLAFSLEEAVAKGQEPGVIAAAFPLVQCLEWEGGLGSEEVDFQRMAPGPPRVLWGGQEVRGPGPPGPDILGYSTGCWHLVPAQGPHSGRGL